ncbi:Acyltransferase [Nesidiocoris tenuis]|uniref:1-acyl-sn-glycerol-3-phosphate acyltransferase n=1 Tax=Nesidiocoris tenuis TaxID=355587 RepID=A0ABN7ANB3_9HEMI|nr:Acyltransferase [Nesidiocoris tenuis]
MKLVFLILNGMLSTLDTWSWPFALLVVSILILLVPAVSSSAKVRYYSCYICYVFYVSLMGVLLAPYFLLKARDITNLLLAGKILKNLTKFIGIKWTVRNEQILSKDRGAVITANHQSILDVLGMFNIWELMGMCTAVAKKEILYVPPFGIVAWLAGLVYIDRRNPESAIQTLKHYSRLIHELKAKLWLFPEGTRNKTGQQLLPYKRGAFRMAIDAQAPIIPVVFSPYYFINGRNKTFDRGEIIISVLEEIPTVGLKPEDSNDLMKQVYELMSKEYEKLKIEVEEKYQLKI